MGELVVRRQRPPSGLDILDALPNEILSAIFAQVYHLEPTVVGSSLVVIELLNPRHSSQTQPTGYFNDPLYTSELGNVPVSINVCLQSKQIANSSRSTELFWPA